MIQMLLVTQRSSPPTTPTSQGPLKELTTMACVWRRFPVRLLLLLFLWATEIRLE